MVFVAHYDLELHQINVKKTFLNGALNKEYICNNMEIFHMVMMIIWFVS